MYFQCLRDALHKRNIAITLTRLPQYLELAPPIAKIALFWKGDARNYDLVHTNGDHGSHFKVRGRPLVLTVLHNVFEENYQKYTTPFQKLYHHVFLKRYLYRALNTADKIVAISLSTKTSLERTFGISNVALIYGGVDTDTFLPKEVSTTDEFTGKVRLLFVGNLTRRKGADLLPKIMEKLGRDYVLFYTSGLRKKGILTGLNEAFVIDEKTRNELIAEDKKSAEIIKPIRRRLRPSPATITVRTISPLRSPSDRNSFASSRAKKYIVMESGIVKRKTCSFTSMAIACAHGVLPAFIIGFTSGP